MARGRERALRADEAPAGEGEAGDHVVRLEADGAHDDTSRRKQMLECSCDTHGLLAPLVELDTPEGTAPCVSPHPRPGEPEAPEGGVKRERERRHGQRRAAAEVRPALGADPPDLHEVPDPEAEGKGRGRPRPPDRPSRPAGLACTPPSLPERHPPRQRGARWPEQLDSSPPGAWARRRGRADRVAAGDLSRGRSPTSTTMSRPAGPTADPRSTSRRRTDRADHVPRPLPGHHRSAILQPAPARCPLRTLPGTHIRTG